MFRAGSGVGFRPRLELAAGYAARVGGAAGWSPWYSL